MPPPLDDGEIFLAVLDSPLFIRASNGMLESRGIGGVARDGNVHVLVSHDGDAFVDVVAAVALDLGAVAVRIRRFLDDIQLARVIIVLGLHIGEAVDPRNDESRVLAETVQNDFKRGLSDLVRRFGDTDGAFRRRERFVPREKTETFGFFGKEHRREVAVAETDLALIRDRTGNTETLQADAERRRRVRSLGAALFEAMAAPTVYAQTAFSKAMG